MWIQPILQDLPLTFEMSAASTLACVRFRQSALSWLVVVLFVVLTTSVAQVDMFEAPSPLSSPLLFSHPQGATTPKNFSSFINPCSLSTKEERAAQFEAFGIKAPPTHCCNRGQWQWLNSTSLSSSSRPVFRGPSRKDSGKSLAFFFDEEEENLCQNQLMDFFDDSPSGFPTSLILFGDSTMKALFEMLQSHWRKGKVLAESEASRCGMMSFLGLPPSSTGWIPPSDFRSSLGPVGPVAFGLSSPYCTDCLACYARSKVNSHPPPFGPSAVVALHLLPLEFALDVELQTDGANTTPMVYSKYLQGKYGNSAAAAAAGNSTTLPLLPACVVSVGLHDMIIPALGAVAFADNVGNLLAVLDAVCGRIVWVSISSTLNIDPQSNSKVAGWNDAVMRIVYRDFLDKVALVDVQHMSGKSSMRGIRPLDLHSDNVHLLKNGALFYDTIAHFFLAKILANEKNP